MLDRKNYHKNHAIHNNDALKHMDKKQNFLDWVITISFYTSLHAIQYKSFPLTIAGNGSIQTFDTFEKYCTGRLGNKHAKLQDLVNIHHSSISAEYSQLKDLCWTARYNDYSCDRDSSNYAKKLKDKIYNYCFEEEILVAS